MFSRTLLLILSLFLVAFSAFAEGEYRRCGAVVTGASVYQIFQTLYRQAKDNNSDYLLLQAVSDETKYTVFDPVGSAMVVLTKKGLQEVVKWRMGFSIFEIKTPEVRTRFLVFSPVLARESKSSHMVIDRAVAQWASRAGLSKEVLKRIEYGYLRYDVRGGEDIWIVDDMPGSAVYSGGAWSSSQSLSAGARLIQDTFQFQLGVTVVFPSREELERASR